MKQFTSKTQAIGKKGEDAAAAFLVKQGYSIVERNVANARGEIDIIAKKKGVYYFCEVKAGMEGSWFNPAENLTKAKLKKFLTSVEHYCYTHAISNYRVLGVIVLLPRDDKEEVFVELMDWT